VVTVARLVIKLGGSFITRKELGKSFPLTIDRIKARRKDFVLADRLRSISTEVARVSQSHQLMLVHGAGPFGHSLVSRLDAEQEGSARLVHQSMLVLNEVVQGALSEAGVNCRTRSPFDLAHFEGRFHTDRLLRKMLLDVKRGVVPVSHGDMVESHASGRGSYTVISGDVVARDASLFWPADRIIMVTDLDGILDRDPSEGYGRTVPRLGLARALELLRSRASTGPDVTGGILEKVRTCKPAILRGIPLQIISGLKPGSLEAACEGKEVGTTVECR